MRRFTLAFMALAAMTMVSCDKNIGDGIQSPGDGENGDNAVENNTPEIDTENDGWDGTLADDASEDIVGDDAAVYWEKGGFTKTVTVDYNGSEAEVTNGDEDIICHIDGADVTIDLETNAVEGVEIVLKGETTDGQFKLYGKSDVKLILDGVGLTSAKSSAINVQSKGSLFIHSAAGTENVFCDAEEQTDESYYPDGVAADDEKRNGCIYCKGNVVFSGTGVIKVTGQKKHGISVKGFVHVRPGVTMVVNEVEDNCVKAEGITVDGGYIWANTSADAGKCLSSDADIDINGGVLKLYTSGGSIYEEEENDTSSPAGMKADANINITGGDVLCVSTGTGGKGLNADADLVMKGGTVNVATSGGKYIYNEALDLDSSPKGVKADGDITIDGGLLNIQVTGRSDGSEGLESKNLITVNGGQVFVYAYDDAINVGGDNPQGLVINGGKVFAFSDNNDGIDSNGKLTVNCGLVIASGSAVPEEGFDCDRTENFLVNGGILIGTGGAAIAPSNSSKQKSLIYNGLSAGIGDLFVIADSDGNTVFMYELPRTMNNGISLLVSSADLSSEETYTVYSQGILSGNTENWNGWFADGQYTPGTSLTTFTPSSTVTTIGNSSGGGPGNGGPGGPGNGNGGWGPGWW